MKLFRRTPKPAPKPVEPAAVGCGFCGRRMGHQIGCPAAG